MTRASMTRTSMVDAPARSRPLTHHDRCDVCGHHGRELLGPLQQHAVLIEDGTCILTGRASPSPDGD